jgi:predicted lactoylglutathione lyase
MQLGAFSVSLAVKDIHASWAFYEKLGFTRTGGNIDQKWLIVRNDTTLIGLFQGMFEKNLLTFNPGWDQDAKEVNPFTDVRELQRRLQEAGIVPVTAADESTTGPAHLVITDPDGNAILIDQHR